LRFDPADGPPVRDSLKVHSAYRDRKLYVWGECDAAEEGRGRRLPFAAPAVRVRYAIGHIAAGNLHATQRDAIIWIPTRRRVPLARGTAPAAGDLIEAWALPVAVLQPDAALYFLDACNRNPHAENADIKIAPTTRFWSAALRFVAALAARERFLPSVTSNKGLHRGRWLPLLSARDRYVLHQLAAAMPAPARAITAVALADARPPADDPVHLLSEFVEWMLDGLVRSVYRPGRAVSQPRGVDPSKLTSLWISRLCGADPEIPGDRKVLSRFFDDVKAWQRPALREAAFPWMLAFRVHEPRSDEDRAPWRVEYRLWRPDGAESVDVSRAPQRQVNRLLANAASVCPDIRAGADHFPLDLHGAFRFLRDTAPVLENEGFPVEIPGWWKLRERTSTVRARPVLKPSSDARPVTFSLNELMKFDWEVAIGGENFTREELAMLAESNAPLVKLHGKWLPVEPQSVATALELWKRDAAPAREVMRMALGVAEAPEGVLFEDARGEGWLGELIDKLGGRTRFEELPVPTSFQGTLRPYQIRGFSWLSFLRQYGLGACLADDMGLGKTVQALALLGRDRAEGVDRPVLLVCPTSVVGNWRKEASRFAPDLPVLVHHGGSRIRGREFIDEAARHALVISSYSLVHRDIEVLRDVPWAGIILDEAQNIKNHETQQSRAVRSLTADYRVALTGTPVENNVGELWSIMEFLNPGLLGNAAEFRRNFVQPIHKRADSDSMVQLRKLTAPFILRRLKTDRTIIEDLPDKMEMKVFCNLTPEQASLYKSVVDEASQSIDITEGIQRKGVILATLTKLKQVCNHPAQFLGDDSPLAGRSGKLARLTEMVEELLSEGDGALIFSQFSDMGEKLRNHLAATFDQEVLFLHGGVPAHKRNEMVERFQSGEGDAPKLFVLSLKAGGTGLNLTAANHVFHFDRWWNPAVENQATDRAFRIGQRRNVQVHKFVCVGTLEEKIDEMIERKKELAENVIGTGEAWLTELSTAEIKDLFALRQEALG
jgi:superfamily II DNA or RNA helicase